MSAEKKTRVCVIGAGMAGLIAARHLKDKEGLSFDVIERNDQVGGTWLYGGDSPMYEDLICNLPWPAMTPWEFALEDSHEDEAFWPREKVLRYLRGYAEHFHLVNDIQFETEVVSVEPVGKSERFCQWIVTTRRLPTGVLQVNAYDFVIICVGNYHYPRYKCYQYHFTTYAHLEEYPKFLVSTCLKASSCTAKTIANPKT